MMPNDVRTGVLNGTRKTYDSMERRFSGRSSGRSASAIVLPCAVRFKA